MSTVDLIQQILQWRFVSQEQEYEKYYRYCCFRIKWLKITKHPDTVRQHLAFFRERATEGVDVAVSLADLIQSVDAGLLPELMEAATVISEGNLKGLNYKEKAEAKRIAENLFKQSIVEESLYKHLNE